MEDLFPNLLPEEDGINNTYNKEEKLLSMLALSGNPFSKSTILTYAKCLGIKMKGSKPFLVKYMSEGVIEKSLIASFVTEYIINPKHWIEMIKRMGDEDFKFLRTIMNSMNVNLSVSGMQPFVTSLYKFFKGEDYLQEYKRANVFNRYTSPESFAFLVFAEMIRLEEMLPYIASLPDYIRNFLAGMLLDKLVMFNVADEDAVVMKRLIDADVLKTPEGYYNYLQLSEAFGFIYSFVQKLDIDEAKRYLNGKTIYTLAFDAIMLLQNNKYNEALKLFSSILKGKVIACFTDKVLNFYYAWTLVNATKNATSKINKFLKAASANCHYGENVMTLLYTAVLNHKKEDAENLNARLSQYGAGPFYALIAKHFNVAEQPSDALDAAFERELDMIETKGINLLKLEFSADFDRFKKEGGELAKMSGMHPTMPEFSERPQWDYTLDELLKINGVAAPVAVKKSQKLNRLVYELAFAYGWTVQPKLQTSKDGVNWSAGRNVALAKLRSRNVDAMTDADVRVSDCVGCYSDGWYGTTTYTLEGPKAVAALIGHPYVYDASTGNHLDVVEERPQISVVFSKETFRIDMNVKTADVYEGYFVRKDGLSTIKVIEIDYSLKETLNKLTAMRFPVEAQPKLKELLSRLSSKVVVMSDLLQSSQAITSKNAHSETVVQLRQSGDIILCALVVKPFGKMPPVCRPGKGMEVITTTLDGEAVQTKRNLRKEKENYNSVLELMVDYEEDASEKIWMLEACECLELLDRLREMPKQCVIEWPEDERFKVRYGALMPNSFNVSLRKVDTWFEISGDVQISTDKKIKIAELMERLAEAKGNYIRLTDNEYIKLSGDLRRYVESINRLASVNWGKIRVSVFNAPQLEGLEDSGMNVSVDDSYRKLMEKIHSSQEIDVKIPKAIKADLRSYQKEGYAWMSRLAHWGAGALLADDMGLGKTVQTITILLSRAMQGPQLVVVPTSLVMNWKDEISRFAPGLNVLILNKPGENRKELIDNAGEYDIVVTTYGLLINEEETLASRVWHTIVLDEAHTIKNRDTKMSKAAMSLKSEFRILLTGTPLQNHVSEIWNLMQFANPGVLGSFQEYTDRFLLPIERDHDKEKQKLLKLIVSPFMLRRTKNDVLDELPEKTEITLKVDLSEEEWAFYDNIRQKALANMEDGQVSAVQALAEITRLRQAACNSRLVEKNIKLKSSKLERFMELVDDLHEGGHRALVFSQFTSHLALVRERLDAEGIKYLYLDGATSAKDRMRLVEEFQHGDMEIFLISLKAGGLGLNLTAADYVVHLDPWWNPAIEEQASDRAYRIGQKKAVTVYRLIATGTIEERIIELHRTKKNMADALLEGGDVSARMTREEIMDLLKLGLNSEAVVNPV